MGIGALNSAIYKRGYTTPRMEEVWSERALVGAIFDVEAGLAEAQATLGIVPEQAAQAIREAAQPSDRTDRRCFPWQGGKSIGCRLGCPTRARF